MGASGIVLALGIVHYFAQSGEKPAAEAPPAPAASSASDDEARIPTDAQNDHMMQLVAKARQLAGDGKFDEADAALQQADKIVPQSPQAAEARRDFAAMRTPEGQLKTQLTKARMAVEHGDYSAADRALAAAEQLNAQAPEIAELKQNLDKAKAKDTRRSSRIAEHLTAMREAIARNDFSAADSEIDAAERVDVDDPTVREARRELVRARNEAQKAGGSTKQ
jgi:uncharacterized protein HemY